MARVFEVHSLAGMRLRNSNQDRAVSKLRTLQKTLAI